MFSNETQVFGGNDGTKGNLSGPSSPNPAPCDNPGTKVHILSVASTSHVPTHVLTLVRFLIAEINAIPFEAPPLAPVKPGYDPRTRAVGVGYTPEGPSKQTTTPVDHTADSAASQVRTTVWDD